MTVTENELIPQEHTTSTLMSNEGIQSMFTEINMLETEIHAHKITMLQKAMLSGEKLNILKSQIPHGQFEKQCKQFCTLNKRQRQIYMKLATSGLQLPNAQSSAHLGIQAALTYLSSDDEVKIQVDAKLEAGCDVTEAEIKRLKTELELEKQRVQDWREQDKEKRDEIESLRTQMFNLRKSKMEVVYEDNAGEVTKELKEKLKHANQKLKEAQDAKIEAIKKTRDNIANANDKTINDQQKRMTAQESSIRYNQEKLNEMESRVLADEAHKESLSGYKKALIEQALALMVLEDYPPNEDQTAAWAKMLSDNQLMLNAQVLGNPEPQSDHNHIVVAETGI